MMALGDKGDGGGKGIRTRADSSDVEKQATACYSCKHIHRVRQPRANVRGGGIPGHS